MENPNKKQMFDSLEAEAMDRLCDSVMRRVKAIEIIRLKIRTAVFGALAILALLAFVPVIIYLLRQASSSGLFDFASLFASDTSYMIGHFQGALLPITDTLPVMSSILMIALALICLHSLRRFIAYRRALGEQGESLTAKLS